MFPTTCTTSASPSESARAGARHTVPAGSPSAGIPSKMTGLPGIKFATLGVSSAGRLGPNPYHPSPTVTNIPLDQISPPLLWNIWCVASYQFVLKPLTNPTTKTLPLAPSCLLLKYSKGFPGGSEGKVSACSAGDRVRSLVWDDPLEKKMSTRSTILAWRIPWTEEPGRLQSTPWCRKGLDTNSLSLPL